MRAVCRARTQCVRAGEAACRVVMLQPEWVMSPALTTYLNIQSLARLHIGRGECRATRRSDQIGLGEDRRQLDWEAHKGEARVPLACSGTMREMYSSNEMSSPSPLTVDSNRSSFAASPLRSKSEHTPSLMNCPNSAKKFR
eukprot:scaffold123275_cov28-Tisochrysis_lutea.AAC.2